MEKTHYKLYKAGKLWLMCLMTAVSLGIISADVTAHAAEEPATEAMSQSTTTSDAVKNDDTQKTETTENAASDAKQSDKQATDSKQNADSAKDKAVDQNANKAVKDDKAADTAQAADKKDAAGEKQSEQLQTAKTNVTDGHFQELKDKTANNPIGIAAGFHIFAGKVVISADCNGNLAVKEYVKGSEFGTRGDSHNIDVDGKDTYYIEQIDEMGPNAFRTGNNYVIFGPNVHYEIPNGQVLCNGNRLDHLKASDLHQSAKVIDIHGELVHLAGIASDLDKHTQSEGVKSDLDGDMNNRFIDVSDVKSGTSMIYVDLDSKYLEASQPITIKGVSSADDGATIVINVKSGNTVNWNTQSKLTYEDGTTPNANESHSKPNHVLWNFSNVEHLNINSGYLMGSVLAPNAVITVGVNADGNLIGQEVDVTGGESHRWDLHTPKTTPAQPGKGTDTPGNKPGTDTGHKNTDHPKDTGNKTDDHKPDTGKDTPKDSGKIDHNKPGDKTDTNKHDQNTPDKGNTTNPGDETPDYPYGPVTPQGDQDTGNKGQDNDHKTPQPSKPDQPQNPDNGKTNTDKPGNKTPETPGKPVQPEQPSHPDKKKPDQPWIPYNPGGYFEDHNRPTTPVTPDQPTTPDDNKPTTPDTPSNPNKINKSETGKVTPNPSKPEKPVKPFVPNQKTTEPVQPTTPETPVKPVETANNDHFDNQPVKPDGQVQVKEDHVSPSNMSAKSFNKETVNASTTQKVLPQTGNHNSTMIAILGFLISLIASVLVNKS